MAAATLLSINILTCMHLHWETHLKGNPAAISNTITTKGPKLTKIIFIKSRIKSLSIFREKKKHYTACSAHPADEERWGIWTSLSSLLWRCGMDVTVKTGCWELAPPWCWRAPHRCAFGPHSCPLLSSELLGFHSLFIATLTHAPSHSSLSPLSLSLSPTLFPLPSSIHHLLMNPSFLVASWKSILFSPPW